jgi:hypothetical protein
MKICMLGPSPKVKATDSMSQVPGPSSLVLSVMPLVLGPMSFGHGHWTQALHH